MFDSLSERLNAVLDRLTRRGALSEADVDAALREVRRALLEADVALDVVRAFTDEVKKRAVGVDRRQVGHARPDGREDRARSADRDAGIERAADRPQRAGAGRHHDGRPAGLRQNHHHREARQAPDRARQAQGADGLARHPPPGGDGAARGARPQVSVETLPIVAGQTPVQIATRALQAARLGGYDVVLLDTAGRTHARRSDDERGGRGRRAANPHEVLLVADALTGQDAVNLARASTSASASPASCSPRVDGDGRGGAALSMRAVTGKPIKLIGTGEKLDALEDFHPARIAGRILGMGDIVSLVEKAARPSTPRRRRASPRRCARAQFDLSDLREQAHADAEHGRHERADGMLPGIAKMKNQIAERNLDEKVLKRQMAIIDSMTPQERRNPDILKASRKRRIAAGSGTKVEDINKLSENAPHHGRRDEGHGRRQARADGRPRQHARLRRRHAEPGADGEACRENAGRLAAGNAGCAWTAAVPAGTAAEFPGSAGLGPKFPGGFPGLGKKK
jgi:signal recognition particle subunit SRP54